MMPNGKQAGRQDAFTEKNKDFRDHGMKRISVTGRREKILGRKTEGERYVVVTIHMM